MVTIDHRRFSRVPIVGVVGVSVGVAIQGWRVGPGRTVPAGGGGVAAGCVAASAGRARGCSGREGASRWISGNVSLRICGVLDICRSEVPDSTALLAVLVGWVGIDGIVGGGGG